MMNKRFRVLVPFVVALCLILAVLVNLTPSTLIASAKSTTVEIDRERGDGRQETAISVETVPDISNITGAIYDEERGEIIVFGVADPDLPALDYNYIQENLVIALRAYYDANVPNVPGVSIEGTEDPLEVIYFGHVSDTHFGNVSFESDRLLKTYMMGKDNVTGQVITSTVSGYQSYPDRMSQIDDTILNPILARYFFTPTLRIEEADLPHGIVFSTTKKFVDWGNLGGISSTASAQAAQEFVDNFNQYYWEYAAERYDLYGDSTLYEMIQLSKISTIAKWAKDTDLELELPGLNDPWLNDYPITSETTPLQTPGIAVTWTQPTNQGDYISTLRGGVYAPGDIERLLLSAWGQELLNQVEESRLPLPPPPPPTPPPPPPPPMKKVIDNNFSSPLGDPENKLQSVDSLWASGVGVLYIIGISDNAVGNGDFEDGPGSLPWEQISPGEIIYDGAGTDGSYGAYLGGYSNVDVSLIQIVEIPADATQARLTYWRGFPAGADAGDLYTLTLLDVNDNLVATLETLDHTDADGYWHQANFDLSDYRGQKLKLRFRFVTNSTVAGFIVDDVSLDYLDEINPTVSNVLASDVVQNGEATFEVVFDESMKTAVPLIAEFKATKTTLSPFADTTYPLTAKSGEGYTNGFLDNDPTRWVGVYNFNGAVPEGEYTLSVSRGQDLAQNVMYADDTHTFHYDVSSPQVNSTYPTANATSVPFTDDLVVSFSEPIDINSFAFTVAPDPGGWSASWNVARTQVVLSHNAFAAGTAVSVSIDRADDEIGNPLLNAPVSWTFTTATTDTTGPSVKETYPTANASNVPANATLLVTFNEAINPGSFTFSITPDPGGSNVSWNVEKTIATISHNAFTSGQTYNVSISQAQDLAGNDLASGLYEWSFSVGAPDTTAPMINGRSPAPNATDVDIETAVVISFTKPINKATFAFTSVPDPGGWLPNWNSDYTVLTLNHNAFTPATEYRIAISTAEDLAGNDLTSTKTWSFETSREVVYLPMIMK